MNMVKRRLSVTSLAHVFYGFLTSFMPPHLAFIMFASFLAYELDEEWHIRDKAYRDLLEYSIGLVLGGIRYIISLFHIIY